MGLIKRIFIFLVIAVVVTGLVYLLNYIEWYKPQISVSLDSQYIGQQPIKVKITDKGRGLNYSVSKLKYEATEITLKRKDYTDPVKEDSFELVLDTTDLTEGPAKLIIEAVDRSFLHFLHGNKTVFEKDMIVDTMPPSIELISSQDYINHGGSGLVIYKTSADTRTSGVVVDDYFFPGYKGHFNDENVYLCFFALPYNKSTDSEIYIKATDIAGNSAKNTFYYRVKPVTYRKSTIPISEKFIVNKMQGLIKGPKPSDLTSIFLKVNNELRKENDSTIAEVSKKTSSSILWKGNFHQLSRSQVEANFADERTYVFNDEPIDKQYHLGYDLAVTKRYPIEAANSGIVTYAGDLGIYGKTVIIDHGMGLTSLYGHMSSLSVKIGDVVNKKQTIGRTGTTGLASGDHLHYGVYIQGVAVRPVEWWDPKWIMDNITIKMDEAEQEFGIKANTKKN